MDKLKRLDGYPSAIVGIAVLATGAFYLYQDYQRLFKDKEQAYAQIEVMGEANLSLLKNIKEKEGTIVEFQSQIGDIASSIGTLKKLTSTDKELLAKYSKVYFLNENYAPKSLVDIPEQYRNQSATNYQISSAVAPFLERLLRDGNANGHNILVASAFRSFSAQSSLKSQYKFLYGSGANKFSADQGYSEHQLGTAVDFTTKNLGNNLSAFESDPAYEWLLKNAYKYGFILSYPKGNEYYIFEPWHWRFVGVSLATHLHNEGKNFYDLDQREIDNYLVKLFE